jgi:hypothetical protein
MRLVRNLCSSLEHLTLHHGMIGLWSVSSLFPAVVFIHDYLADSICLDLQQKLRTLTLSVLTAPNLGQVFLILQVMRGGHGSLEWADIDCASDTFGSLRSVEILLTSFSPGENLNAIPHGFIDEFSLLNARGLLEVRIREQIFPPTIAMRSRLSLALEVTEDQHHRLNRILHSSTTGSFHLKSLTASSSSCLRSVASILVDSTFSLRFIQIERTRSRCFQNA